MWLCDLTWELLSELINPIPRHRESRELEISVATGFSRLGTGVSQQSSWCPGEGVCINCSIPVVLGSRLFEPASGDSDLSLYSVLFRFDCDPPSAESANCDVMVPPD